MVWIAFSYDVVYDTSHLTLLALQRHSETWFRWPLLNDIICKIQYATTFVKFSLPQNPPVLTILISTITMKELVISLYA